MCKATAVRRFAHFLVATRLIVEGPTTSRLSAAE